MKLRPKSLKEKKLIRPKTPDSLNSSRSASKGIDFSKSKGRGENVFLEWQNSILSPNKYIKPKRDNFLRNSTSKIDFISHENNESLYSLGNKSKLNSEFRKRDFTSSQLTNVPGHYQSYKKLEEKQIKSEENKKMHNLVLKQLESHYFNPEDPRSSTSTSKQYSSYKKDVVFWKNTGKKTEYPMKKFIYHTANDFLVAANKK